MLDQQTELKKHGGKRIGAGRKSTGKEATVIMRVPISLAEKIKNGELNNVTKSNYSQPEPQQTWAFSYEDLQEQARLIERLTEENQRLQAELSLKNKSISKAEPSESPNLTALDKIQLLALLKQLEARERPTVYRYGQNQRGCECLNAKGEPCKNVSEEMLVQELRLSVCKTHFQKYNHLDC